jgi:hypothetical protein
MKTKVEEFKEKPPTDGQRSPNVTRRMILFAYIDKLTFCEERVGLHRR